jgi:hypothetical protein
MALVAGAIGIALGYAIAAALMPGVAGTLRGLYGASVPGTLTFDPIWAVSGLGDHACSARGGLGGGDDPDRAHAASGACAAARLGAGLRPRDAAAGAWRRWC